MHTLKTSFKNYVFYPESLRSNMRSCDENCANNDSRRLRNTVYTSFKTNALDVLCITMNFVIRLLMQRIIADNYNQ